MKKAENKHRRNRTEPKSGHEPASKQVFEQANRMLLARFGNSAVIQHNLEKGLGNEQAFRELLIDFLPRRYGVAKGKIVNSSGGMSKHVDVIIYDALHCPRFFIDENDNQILPVEGVFAAIEVKTTLTSTTLAKAFANLSSIYPLAPRKDTSRNDYVTRCFPYLLVFAFTAKQSLLQIGRQFIKLSRLYPVEKSCYSYTPKSPAFPEHTGDQHLVSSVDVLNLGGVRHMLSGNVVMSVWGAYTFGMFLTGLLLDFQNAPPPELDVHDYLSWYKVGLWQDPNKEPTKYILIEEHNPNSGHAAPGALNRHGMEASTQRGRMAFQRRVKKSKERSS